MFSRTKPICSIVTFLVFATASLSVTPTTAETAKSKTTQLSAVNADMEVLFSKMDKETVAYESAYKAGNKDAFCEHAGLAYAYTVKFKAKVDEAAPLLESNGALEKANSMRGLSEKLTVRIKGLVDNYGTACSNLTSTVVD